MEYADDSDYYNFYDVYITLEQENTLSKEEITKIVSDKIIELLKNNISKAVIVYENFEYYEYPEVFLLHAVRLLKIYTTKQVLSGRIHWASRVLPIYYGI